MTEPDATPTYPWSDLIETTDADGTRRLTAPKTGLYHCARIEWATSPGTVTKVKWLEWGDLPTTQPSETP